MNRQNIISSISGVVIGGALMMSFSGSAAEVIKVPQNIPEKTPKNSIIVTVETPKTYTEKYSLKSIDEKIQQKRGNIGHCNVVITDTNKEIQDLQALKIRIANELQ